LTFQFDSLRTRIVVFFAVLLVVVQGLALIVVNTANTQIAKDTIGQELDVGERIFLRLLDQQRDQLEQSASLLASEFGFRQAVGTNFITEVVELPNGDLVNKAMKVIPDVKQTLGFTPEQFAKLGLPSRTNPECKKSYN